MAIVFAVVGLILGALSGEVSAALACAALGFAIGTQWTLRHRLQELEAEVAKLARERSFERAVDLAARAEAARSAADDSTVAKPGPPETSVPPPPSWPAPQAPVTREVPRELPPRVPPPPPKLPPRYAESR